jgi:hypothetical protein
MSCQAGRCCGVGVVGCVRGGAAASPKGVCGVSGRSLERAGVEGDTPVRENSVRVFGMYSRVAASSWNLL